MLEIKLSDVSSYIFAGKAIFTIRNPKTDRSFTYKITQPKDCDKFFVKVLTGPDNTSDYEYIGFIVDSRFIYGRNKSRIFQDAPSVKAFGWFLNNINSLGPVECFHHGFCGRCGRLLTVIESIENGLGPECFKKVA